MVRAVWDRVLFFGRSVVRMMYALAHHGDREILHIFMTVSMLFCAERIAFTQSAQWQFGRRVMQNGR